MRNIQIAFELVCKEIAEFTGSCPLDRYDFELKKCEENCENTYSECFAEYFKLKAKNKEIDNMSSGNAPNKPLDLEDLKGNLKFNKEILQYRYQDIDRIKKEIQEIELLISEKENKSLPHKSNYNKFCGGEFGGEYQGEKRDV